MASSSPQKTPRGGGRLSLYFDIEEDLGILDFDKDQFAFISSDHFWLLNDDDEIRNEVGSMESTLQWMDDFSVIQDDSYFTISNGYPKDTPSIYSLFKYGNNAIYLLTFYFLYYL